MPTAQDKVLAILEEMTARERYDLYAALLPSPWQRACYKTTKLLLGRELALGLVSRFKFMWPNRR